MRILIIFALWLLLTPPVAFAAEETCDCYCTSASGATDQGTKMTSASCQTQCQGKGARVAAFACGANQHPARTPACFTQAQCDGQGGVWDQKSQPEECPSGLHYCYPNPAKAIKTKLQVSIGGLSVVSDLGEYVSKAYDWLIGTATLIAIVWIMVGGAQWAFGGVSAEQIKKAQKRMMNGVVGLVLLMSTYLILFTINPQLLKLQVPSLPLVKTVNLTDDASCEALKTEGYELEYTGAEECGTTAKVLKDQDGAEVADGTVCNFTTCALAAELCIPGEKPVCLKCTEMGPNNAAKVAPTPEICSAFNSLSWYQPEQRPEKFTYTYPEGTTRAGETVDFDGTVIESMRYCFYTRDTDAGGEILGYGTCAQVDLNCEQNPIISCESYEDIPVIAEGKTTTLNEIDLGKNNGLTENNAGFSIAQFGDLGEATLGSFCAVGSLHDVCDWNRKKNGETGACYIQAMGRIEWIPGGVPTPLSSYSCKANEGE